MEMPKALKTKKNMGAYLPLYAVIYLEEKAKKENKSIGKVIAEMVESQEDLKKQLSDHLNFFGR